MRKILCAVNVLGGFQFRVLYDMCRASEVKTWNRGWQSLIGKKKESLNNAG